MNEIEKSYPNENILQEEIEKHELKASFFLGAMQEREKCENGQEKTNVEETLKEFLDEALASGIDIQTIQKELVKLKIISKECIDDLQSNDASEKQILKEDIDKKFEYAVKYLISKPNDDL